MKIIIWGAGMCGKSLKRVCGLIGKTVEAFVDNDSQKWGSKFEGFRCFLHQSWPTVV